MLAFAIASTITVSTASLTIITGSVLPLLVALLAKLNAKPAVKAALNIALGAVAAACAILIANGGKMTIQGLVVGTFIAVVSADQAYNSIWKQTGTFEAINKATKTFGIGKDKPADEA